jgi:hypothetical protein
MVIFRFTTLLPTTTTECNSGNTKVEHCRAFYCYNNQWQRFELIATEECCKSEYKGVIRSDKSKTHVCYVQITRVDYLRITTVGYLCSDYPRILQLGYQYSFDLYTQKKTFFLNVIRIQSVFLLAA